MRCVVCGYRTSRWVYNEIIKGSLTSSWGLSEVQRKQFNQRESQFCPRCKSSTRTRAISQAVIRLVPFVGTNTIKQWVDVADKSNLRIAEINSCGNIHYFLSRVKGLKYSEYDLNFSFISKFKNLLFSIPAPKYGLFYFNFSLIKTIRSIILSEFQDITNLSYKDSSFDLILHSEVLEHVTDPHQALKECRRVLKPGGICLFTIPVIFNRKTIRRAKMKGDKLHHLRPASYHGSAKRKDWLVFWEFGGDFVKKEKLEIVFSQPSTQTYVFALKR